jgi:hypothetical protein
VTNLLPFESGQSSCSFEVRRLQDDRCTSYRQALLWVIVLLAFGLACASPEAIRTRGGGPGADVGNRAAPVVFHAGAKPYFDTPCVTEPVRCEGPLPLFGAN